MGVVDVTMNGEDDVSHYLSEYFGSCRGGLGPGALTGVLAQIRKATRYRLVGWASSGSAAAIPALSFGSSGGGLQLAARGVGGVNLGFPELN